MILYRSQSDQGTLPPYATMMTNVETNLTKVVEGDVIFTFNSGITNHTAIVVEIKRSGSTVTGIDVIDANWLTDNGVSNREVIGRHLFTIAYAQQYFRIWKGVSYYYEPYIP